MILKVFLAGMAAACFTSVVEVAFSRLFGVKTLTMEIIKAFLLAGFFEETIKYLVAKKFAFKSKYLDEPVDFMIYMIIAALGFVLVENLILFFAVDYSYTIKSAFWFTAFRFVGAMLLHTLTSAVVGFFSAISSRSRSNKFLFLGLFLAIIAHGFYNFIIADIFGSWRFFILVIIIAALFYFTMFGFKKLNNLKRVK